MNYKIEKSEHTRQKDNVYKLNRVNLLSIKLLSIPKAIEKKKIYIWWNFTIVITNKQITL
jgi:hypothetical protein